MNINREPQPTTLKPLKIGNILLYGGNKDVYVIENVLQRELVWSYSNIEELWSDFINCTYENIKKLLY